MSAKSKPILSVIIPVYNVEQYLEDCLISVFKQSGITFEIICVEDCSTDNSLDVLMKYKDHDQVKIIRNQTNGGLSMSRNIGLRYVQGQYTLFLDSDDYLIDGFFKEVREYLESGDFDIIGYNFTRYDENNNRFEKNNIHNKEAFSYDYQGTKGFVELEQNKDLILAVWSRIYRTAFIRKLDLTFIEGIYNEDVPFTFVSLLNAKKTKMLAKEYIVYRIRRNSITSQELNDNHVKGTFIAYINSLDFWRSFESNEKLDKIIKLFFDRHYIEYIKRSLKELDAVDIRFDNKYLQFLWDHMEWVTKESEMRIPLSESKQPIIIYGAGKVGKKVFGDCVKEKVDLIGFAVTGEPKLDYYCTHKVKRIESYLEYSDKALIIIATSLIYHDDIKANLLKLGFKNFITSNDLY